MSATALGVVVPAWNEEHVIGDCLAALAEQELPGSVRVAVIANGCTDRTAEVARTFVAQARRRGIELVVIERATTGKAAALNTGDDVCPPGAHRLYLDADVRLAPRAFVALVTAFDGGVDFAAPMLALDYSDSPSACQAYWRCWAALPNVRRQVVGAGAYGVSARGRARWARFPDLIADDLFVRSHFSKEEGVTIDGVDFTTSAPTSMVGTLRMLTRWRRGNLQLRKLASDGWVGPSPILTNSPIPSTSLRHTCAAILPHASVKDFAVFAAMTAVVRTLTVLPTQPGTWERGR